MWTRRGFLAFAPALLLSISWPCRAGVERGELILTDPGCSPEAFAEIMDYFRKLRAQQQPMTEDTRLRDGRAWLAGKEESELARGEESLWLEVPRGDSGSVKVRVLRPAGPLQGVVLALHGGGWAMGTAVSDEKRNWQLARAARVAVVSADYRLAPEHPFPAAPDDCEAVARWLVEQSSHLFGTSKLAIAGASAGAHLAALTLLRLEPSLREAFLAAVLYYGVFDLGRSEVWRTSTAEDFPDLSPEDMNLFLEWFVPSVHDDARRAPNYSPMYADLRGMPPALFLVGGADLLAEDTRRFAERWAEHGNAAQLVEYPGAPHGFNGLGVKCGLDADEYAARFVAEGLKRTTSRR